MPPPVACACAVAAGPSSLAPSGAARLQLHARAPCRHSQTEMPCALATRSFWPDSSMVEGARARARAAKRLDPDAMLLGCQMSKQGGTVHGRAAGHGSRWDATLWPAVESSPVLCEPLSRWPVCQIGVSTPSCANRPPVPRGPLPSQDPRVLPRLSSMSQYRPGGFQTFRNFSRESGSVLDAASSRQLGRLCVPPRALSHPLLVQRRGPGPGSAQKRVAWRTQSCSCSSRNVSTHCKTSARAQMAITPFDKSAWSLCCP